MRMRDNAGNGFETNLNDYDAAKAQLDERPVSTGMAGGPNPSCGAKNLII